jgi:DNA-binding MarR family transcriptional regulator
MAGAPSPIGLDLDCLPTLLGFNIRRAQIALWRDFNRNVAEGDVRPGEFSALLLAQANPGIAQIDIANQLGIDKASVVSLVDRMEEFGWVERRRSTEDRRRQGIFLTTAGTKACRSLRKEMIDHERKFVDRYTDQELRTLIALLRRLHDVD